MDEVYQIGLTELDLAFIVAALRVEDKSDWAADEHEYAYAELLARRLEDFMPRYSAV